MQRNSLRILPAAILAVIILAASSCREEEKLDVAAGIDPKRMPTMQTVNVATLISDSGITQYKIVSPLWQVYDEVDTPYWSFPKGLYLQKYDRRFKVIASVACDSARYFKHSRIWRLDGNVEMHNTPNELFLTQQLFWDERKHRIYSDSFIHIETAVHILEGYGFNSNEKLSDYTVLRPSGIFPVNSHETDGAQSISAGSKRLTEVPASATAPTP